MHWNAAKRVLKYLKDTVETGINFESTKEENQLVAYSDADFASCSDTRKSVSGIVIMLNEGPVIWFSRKQNIVADSTTHAEYVAAYDATREVIWARQLMDNIGFEQKEPTVLHCDNAAAEKLITNPVFHRRTKHIDTKFHFTREQVKDGKIVIKHVSTDDQVADILTKPLSFTKFDFNRKLLNMS